jgi:hypothetical protein
VEVGIDMKRANILSILALFTVSSSPVLILATSPEIPAIDITIQFRGRGIFHVYQALEAAAKDSRLKCSPTMEKYARGEIRDADNKPITRPLQMLCAMDPAGGIQAATLGDGKRGQVHLRVYYEIPRIPVSIVKSKVDAVVANIENRLKADPLIESIENTVDEEARPVTSKIK